MTIYVLTLIVFALSATQPTRYRTLVALCYAGISFGHLVAVSPFVDGHWYYLSAGAGDLLVMGLILQVSRMPQIGVSLLRVCLVEMLLNVFGWVAWWNYYEPTLYNEAFYIVQLWVVLILIRKDRADELGGYQVHNWADNLRLVFSPSRSSLSSRGGQT